MVTINNKYKGDYHPKPPQLLDFSAAPIIKELRESIYCLTGQWCNHCVANLYRDGDDYIAPHQDKTLDMEPGTGVYTFSFGVERKLRLVKEIIHPLSDEDKAAGKKIPKKTLERVHEIDLPSASLNKLGWETNLQYKHTIVKEHSVAGVRYGLTFRSMKTLSSHM